VKELFALIPTNEKKQLRFKSIICLAKTREELESLITKEYWGSASMKPKGTNYEMKEFMQDKAIVKINYEIVK